MPLLGTNRAESAYPGPAQIRLYVDGYWIDDACAVQWQVQDTKVPKWGYNDRFFRSVALGTTIVQGMLSIQFRYIGYLANVISKNARNREEAEALIQNAGAKTTAGWISDKVLFGSKEEVADWAVLAAIDSKSRDPVFNYLKGKFWDQQEDSKQDKPWYQKDTRERLTRAGSLPPFDIQIRYNPNDSDVALQQVISAVYLTGESKVVEISHPDGSQPLREVYTFFAKDLTPRTQSGGAVKGSD